ncbi:MAG: 30S ribosomal protein S16 [Treponema sp.]|nr:30S ribosomal protein S16 [Treponema sp.]
MVKIRLKRFGAKKRPFYRIVVQDARKPRDGKTIEELGVYQPVSPAEKQSAFNEDRVKYWLSVGAQPTPTVKRILNKNGLAVDGTAIVK